MNGINGLLEALINPVANMSRKETGNETEGISFNQFMQQWKGNRVNSTGQKPTLGKEEQQLLEKGLEQLLNFRLELNKTPKQQGALNADELKKLLQKMAQDTGFLNSLSPEMKTLLQSLLQSLKEGKEIKPDTKGLDELMQVYSRELEKKKEKMMAEVNELLAAIQERLALVGITVTARVVEKNGEKSVQVTFQRNSANGSAAQTTGNSNRSDDGTSVFSRSILQRLAAFLSGAETPEQANLNKQTFELREDLRKYLKKESQPVEWRKEEIIHKAQYGSLLDPQEITPETAAKLEQTLGTAAVEQLLKGEVQEAITILKQASDGKEPLVKQEAQKAETTFTNLFSNVETSFRDVRTMLENIVREDRPQPMPMTEDLFSQMVEKFRMDVKQGVSQMEITLHPEELGNMFLKLTVEKGIVTAQFLTENIRVKELIEQNIAQLRDTFAKDGIVWDKITVDVNQDSLQQNPFAAQSHQQQTREQRQSGGKRQSFAESMADELELAEAELEGGMPAKDPSRLVDYRV